MRWRAAINQRARMMAAHQQNAAGAWTSLAQTMPAAKAITGAIKVIGRGVNQ